MFRKISTKMGAKKREKVGRSPSKAGGAQGAAVPYTEPEQLAPTAEGSVRSRGSSVGGASSQLTTESAEYGDGHVLGEAAAKGDIDGAKQLLKSGYDVNGRDEVSNRLHTVSRGGLLLKMHVHLSCSTCNMRCNQGI